MAARGRLPGCGAALLGRSGRVSRGRNWAGRRSGLRRHARGSCHGRRWLDPGAGGDLRGDVEHAYHPGGGLHHAMRTRASGFCIYNDVALAIARARRDGLRVLYVDLDVHHSDGVQALNAGDPGVLTISFHETGRSLFPRHGFRRRAGGGEGGRDLRQRSARADVRARCWLAAVRGVVPALAAPSGRT